MSIRNHLTYANVAATIALVGVIGGGGAYAAGVIDSGDIENNSLQSRDLKNREAVKGRDVTRNAISGKEIREKKLDASGFAPLSGGLGTCNPVDASFVNCATANVRLNQAGKLLVIATGNFFSEGGAADLSCRIAIDGENTEAGALPGEEASDNTSLGATDGFAATLVTGRVSRGKHALALRCSQGGADDGQLASASIAVLGISG